MLYTIPPYDNVPTCQVGVRAEWQICMNTDERIQIAYIAGIFSDITDGMDIDLGFVQPRGRGQGPSH